jgi:hypothetical protein
MENELKAKINSMSDTQVVRFFEHFSNQVFAGSTTDFQEMKDNIPDELKDLDVIAAAESASEEKLEMALSPAESVVFARSILNMWADDSKLSLILKEALSTYRDNEMVVGTILAAGIALSMVIFTSTHKANIGVGSAKVQITGKSVEEINATSGLIKNLLDGLGSLKNIFRVTGK